MSVGTVKNFRSCCVMVNIPLFATADATFGLTFAAGTILRRCLRQRVACMATRWCVSARVRFRHRLPLSARCVPSPSRLGHAVELGAAGRDGFCRFGRSELSWLDPERIHGLHNEVSEKRGRRQSSMEMVKWQYGKFYATSPNFREK